MTRHTGRRAAALLVAGLVATACGGTESPPAAGGPDSCYEGETATFSVPFAPGGGYDVIARGLAPYLEDQLGATVVVENTPGAGGLVLANELNQAAPDGLSFGLFASEGFVGSAVARAPGVNYDPTAFTPVARLAQDNRVLLTGPTTGITSVESVLAAPPPLQWTTSGPGANDHIDANVVPTILGIPGNVEIVTGFAGSAETELAVTAGQVDLGSGTLGTRIDGIRAGDQRPLLLMSRDRDPLLPDVPTILERDLGPQRELADAYLALQEVGRSVLAPPGLPENCLRQLEGAFRTAAADPEFLEEVGGSVDVTFAFAGSEELRASLQRALGSPQQLVTLLQRAYAS